MTYAIDPATLSLLGATFADPQLAGPALAPKIRNPDFYQRLFERMGPHDDSLSDEEKSRLGRQGLLQLGIGMLSQHGVGLGGDLAAGLQNGLLAMNNGAQDASTRRYQADIAKRMQANTDKEMQIAALRQGLIGPDGKLDQAKFAQYATLDPEGAKQLRDAIAPQVRYSSGEMTTPSGGTLPYFYDPTDPTGAFDLSGAPLYGGNVAGPSGGARQVLGNALHDAVASVESGGNPAAVSPKGAVGTMQTMPGTLAAPGFGVAPARDGSPAEQTRVGQDYVDAMVKKYGPIGGLAAYNWGPANWEAALSRSGGDPAAALRLAPKETQDYVPRVLGRTGGADPDPFAGRPGFVGPKAAKGDAPSGYRYSADGLRLEAIPGGPADKQAEGVPLGDGSKTGAPYLATLPQQQAAQVRALAEGRMQFPSGAALRQPYWQSMLSAVSQYDPSFDAINFNARNRTRADFTSGKSKDNMTALNQVGAHLELLNSNIDKVAGHQIPGVGNWINAAENAYAKRSGEPGIIEWNQTADAVAHETRKLFAGAGGGTEKELESYLANLSPDNSVAQKKAALRSIAELVQSRINILAGNYQQGMGTTEDPFVVAYPHTAQVLGSLISGDATPAASTKPAAVIRYDAKGNRIP